MVGLPGRKGWTEWKSTAALRHVNDGMMARTGDSWEKWGSRVKVS